MKITKHFIKYHCPGTFVDEVKPIEVAKQDLTIESAVKHAPNILARHNSKPYGFVLVTETHEEGIIEGKLCRSDPDIINSGMHYLDGVVFTLDTIPDTKENEILRFNMQANDIPAMVRTRNSWSHCGALGRNDVVLQGTEIVARGEDYHQ